MAASFSLVLGLSTFMVANSMLFPMLLKLFASAQTILVTRLYRIQIVHASGEKP